MYPAKFDYQRVASAEEAIAILKENDEAKVLAGGHSLIPMMKLRLAQPEVLVDIGRIESMKGIQENERGFRIGALTTHSEVEHDARFAGAIHDGVSRIGDPSVRNRGTLGGNIAHADPASDWPTLLVGTNSMVAVLSGDGMKRIAAADFFTGLFETALEEDELVGGALIPHLPANSGSAYVKLSNPASRYATVGVCAVVTMDGDSIASATVAIGGLLPNARRCAAVEAAIANGSDIATAAAAVADDLPDDDLIGDMHASAEYRKAVAPELVARALTMAMERAKA